jgi:methionyl-tRNA formyltransferase
LRVLFIGTADFACPSLTALLDASYPVVEAVTQPDRPKGRGRKLTPPPVKTLALARGLPVFQPERLRDPSAVLHLHSLRPDLIVVAAYGQILSPAVLALPPYGCINVHGSLLPKYRGAAPIARAILTGERKTGVTTMLMDEGMDTGPILLAAETEIAPEDNLESLHDRLAGMGAELLLQTLQKLARGELAPRAQEHALATYAPKISKSEAKIDWRAPARDLCNQIRAFDPAPGAYSTWRGKTIKLFRPELLETPPAEPPGTLVAADSRGLVFAASGGYLIVREVQAENRPRLPAAEFLRGTPLRAGLHPGEQFS